MIPLFAFNPTIRKIVYTTHAIESLNRVIRKPIETRGPFAAEEAAIKLIYLAVVGRLGVRPHEGIIDRFLHVEDLRVNLALIVILDAGAGLGEHGPDREKEPHRTRLEDAPLGVHQRHAFSFEHEPGLEVVAGQVIVERRELADMRKGRHAHRSIPILALTCPHGLVLSCTNTRCANP